jgi:nicotinamide-nucleotide amidase
MSARRAELIAVGSELLGPWHLDTNGLYLARRLGEVGIAVRYRGVVSDDAADIEAVFRVALGRSRLIIATGGLGPTVDDRTRETVAALLGRPLLEDASIAKDLEERYRRLGLEMSPGALRQAMAPEGATILPNRRGSAPGLFLKEGETTLVLLPGVPSEMRQMVDEELLPRLAGSHERLVQRTLKISGLSESDVDRRLEPVAREAKNIDWTILAAPGCITIHLSQWTPMGAPSPGIVRAEREIRGILGRHLFAADEETMEEVVGKLLMEVGANLAVAESMTGGGLARRITTVPGASRYFLGGIVCYSDETKVRSAGVQPETLTSHGAVSREVAIEMAAGIRKGLGATWGLSVTGYAGPGGGDDRPPGTGFIGLSGPGDSSVEEFSFIGDRTAVRERAAQRCLDLLRLALLGGEE